MGGRAEHSVPFVLGSGVSGVVVFVGATATATDPARSAKRATAAAR